MKVGDLVEARECRYLGSYCSCVFCSGNHKSRLGLVIGHEIVGHAKNSLWTVQFSFGEWRVYANEVNMVSE